MTKDTSRLEHVDVEVRLETVVLSVRLPAALAKVLRMKARRRGVTMSQYIRLVLEADVDSDQTRNSGWPFEFIEKRP